MTIRKIVEQLLVTRRFGRPHAVSNQPLGASSLLCRGVLFGEFEQGRRVTTRDIRKGADDAGRAAPIIIGLRVRIATRDHLEVLADNLATGDI